MLSNEKELTIYIDRLREGKEESISHVLSPAFLEIEERDLRFLTPITIKGKSSLAKDHLIIQLFISLEGEIRCSICSEWTLLPIQIPKFLHTCDLCEIKGSVYPFSNALREEILLEVPIYVECGGNCPKRAELKKYLTKKPGKDDSLDKVQFPFANLHTIEEN